MLHLDLYINSLYMTVNKLIACDEIKRILKPFEK